MAQTSRQTPQNNGAAHTNATRSNPARSGNPAKRAAGVQHPLGRVTFGDWVAGARLRTLTLAIGPVAAGTGAARPALGTRRVVHWVRALLCLAVALCLQIGVNYANDYSDGIRGTDAHRVGPARLTGSGVVEPKRVLTVALVFFGLAAVAGLLLVIASQQWWLIAVGAVAIVAAWFYTGGKRPYGYCGSRRARRLRLLRAGGHGRHHLRAGARREPRELARRSRRSASSPARCSW